MSWNYYLSNNTISVAEKFLEKADTYNRKTLVWFTGDHYSALYRDNIIISHRGYLNCIFLFLIFLN